VWAGAWRRLAHMSPGVELEPRSAGYRDSVMYGTKKHAKLERRPTLWKNPYFDFGAVKDGTLTIDQPNAVVLTKDSISTSGGYALSQKLEEEWRAQEAAHAVVVAREKHAMAE